MTQPIQANGFVPAVDRQILNSRFVYTPSAKTDVARTWARNGWTPPSREAQREAMRRLNPFMNEDAPCSIN